jgi:hypothetical protein
MFCQQLPHWSSFWRSPRESSFWRSQNLRIGLCCAAAPSGEPSKPHRMNNFQQFVQNQYFAGATRSKAAFFTHNTYDLYFLAATSTQ